MITLRLDEQAKTATVVRALTHPLKLLSASQGNVETLPNGNMFVGGGSQRWFTEFNPSGKVVFDGHIARGNDNYRAFRYPWGGHAATPPKVVATPRGQAHRPGELERGDRAWPAGSCWPARTRVAGAVGTAPSHGFETAITARRHEAVRRAARLRRGRQRAHHEPP